MAVWSECTDAVIPFAAQRTVKFIKNPTQQEILPDAVQSRRESRGPALPGSRGQPGARKVFAARGLPSAPGELGVPSRQPKPPLQDTLPPSGLTFTVLQVR